MLPKYTCLNCYFTEEQLTPSEQTLKTLSIRTNVNEINLITDMVGNSSIISAPHQEAPTMGANERHVTRRVSSTLSPTSHLTLFTSLISMDLQQNCSLASARSLINLQNQSTLRSNWRTDINDLLLAEMVSPKRHIIRWLGETDC